MHMDVERRIGSWKPCKPGMLEQIAVGPRAVLWGEALNRIIDSVALVLMMIFTLVTILTNNYLLTVRCLCQFAQDSR
jgi:hypothetical protein